MALSAGQKTTTSIKFLVLGGVGYFGFGGGGGIYGWAREIGTICQIGVSTGKTVHLFVQKGSFSVISHYVFNECRPSTVFYSMAILVVRNCRQWPFGPKKCSPLLQKRQFDKWCPFHAHTGGAASADLIFMGTGLFLSFCRQPCDNNGMRLSLS